MHLTALHTNFFKVCIPLWNEPIGLIKKGHLNEYMSKWLHHVHVKECDALLINGAQSSGGMQGWAGLSAPMHHWCKQRPDFFHWKSCTISLPKHLTHWLKEDCPYAVFCSKLSVFQAVIGQNHDVLIRKELNVCCVLLVIRVRLLFWSI